MGVEPAAWSAEHDSYSPWNDSDVNGTCGCCKYFASYWHESEDGSSYDGLCLICAFEDGNAEVSPRNAGQGCEWHS